MTQIQLAISGRDVEIEFTNSRIGFFAQMNFCLDMAYFSEVTEKRVFITLSSTNYRDPEHGPNWFHYFFDEMVAEPPKKKYRSIKVSDNSELSISASCLSLSEANALFFRHFSIRPEINEIINSEVIRLGIDENTLGVHYRGTDKYQEAKIVNRSLAINKICAFLEVNKNISKIFVSSDDASFIRMISSEVLNVDIVHLDDSVRSEGCEPVHLSGLKNGNRLIAQDALLNCLILSRCNQLIRTTSFLSAWSSIFNPSMRVYLLNIPNPKSLWFPETKIIDSAQIL